MSRLSCVILAGILVTLSACSEGTTASGHGPSNPIPIDCEAVSKWCRHTDNPDCLAVKQTPEGAQRIDRLYAAYCRF